MKKLECSKFIRYRMIKKDLGWVIQVAHGCDAHIYELIFCIIRDFYRSTKICTKSRLCSDALLTIQKAYRNYDCLKNCGTT